MSKRQMLLSLAAVFFCFSLKAQLNQSHYRPGFIISKCGDTLYGQLYKQGHRYPYKFLFKSKLTDVGGLLSADNVKKIVFEDNGERYIAASLVIKDPYVKGPQAYNIAYDRINTSCFLKVMVEGDAVNLYYLNFKDLYFISTGKDTLHFEQLLYYDVRNLRGFYDDMFEGNPPNDQFRCFSYQGILCELLAADDPFNFKVSQIGFDEQNIADIIVHINKVDGTNYIAPCGACKIGLRRWFNL